MKNIPYCGDFDKILGDNKDVLIYILVDVF